MSTGTKKRVFSTKFISAKVDTKGRVVVPEVLREELGIEPGDILFFERDNEGWTRFVKVTNPFDGLAHHAIEEWEAGKTKTIEEIAAEMDVKLGDG